MAQMQDNNQLEAMAQLEDLSDEIGADDWTIPREEITRRRLVRQTPRYKIYKADWFGDVMVYEPIARQQVRIQMGQNAPVNSQTACQAASSEELNQSVIERETFRLKLNELCLSLERAHVTTSENNDTPACEKCPSSEPDQGVDSAYSSISSTPQYYTKHSQNYNEFEFPHQIEPSCMTVACKQETTRLEPATVNCMGHVGVVPSGSRVAPIATSPVILNRDSFSFSFQQATLGIVEAEQEHGEQCGATREADAGNYEGDQSARHSSGVSPAATSGWFELNELRLIAHENFILFMGASIESQPSTRSPMDDLQQTTSLVMQMSHPKSVSLHDLLHHDKTTNAARGVLSSASRSDQFKREPLAHWHRQRTRLTTDAKLNICQQVTDAMTYLHDKNIVHARLTSLNVYIEPNQRVKVSLIDTDERQLANNFHEHAPGLNRDETPANRLRESQTNQFPPCDSAQTGRADSLNQSGNMKVAFNLPSLTYLSPEIIRTIKVESDGGVQMDAGSLTKQADVFSFGTLLFELFEERFPFASITKPSTMPHGTNKSFHSLDMESQEMNTTTGHNWNGNIRASASELIYLIGSGQTGKRNEASDKCPQLIEHIISNCWSENPNCRPTFKQLRFEK